MSLTQMLQMTLSTPLIHDFLFDVQVAHFTEENLLFNPFLFSHLQLSFVCLKRLLICSSQWSCCIFHSPVLANCMILLFLLHHHGSLFSLNYSLPFCVFYPCCFVTHACISQCVLLWFLTSPKACPKVLCPASVR